MTNNKQSNSKTTMDHDGRQKQSAQNTSSCLLELFLGLHETCARISTMSWDFLTIRDLATLFCVSKDLREKLKQVDYVRCRDGKDYLLPFPGLPGILQTPGDLERDAGLFPHQLASWMAMHRLENRSREFGELRGGILGDAPGLGKTITMLALIASTAGQRPVTPKAFWDEQGVAEGWKYLRLHPMGKEELLKTLRPIRKWYEQRGHCNHPLYSEVASYISPPYPDDRFPTLMDLERYVRKKFQNFLPTGTLEVFRQALLQLQGGLDKRKRKLLKSQTGKRLMWERTLIPTSATLIIVPNALLEHWFQQIHLHLKLEIFGDPKENRILGIEGQQQHLRGVVYLDGVGDLADVIQGGRGLKQFHSEVPVLPAWELSKYLMVITTFSRCEAEYQKAFLAGRMEGVGRKRPRHSISLETNLTPTSPFTLLRWLRIVVDEGHELGTHDAEGAVVEFINNLAAERRWVCSGTPITGNEDDQKYTSKAMAQLQRLLFFLRHPKYGVSKGGDDAKKQADAKKQWKKDIQDPFLGKLEIGYERICRLLRETMVMHRKEDIGLPKPIFNQIEQNAFLPISRENEIIEISKDRGRISPISFLLDQYLHSEDFQSLVDEAQAKYIIKSLELARRGVHSTNSDSVPISDYHNMFSLENSNQQLSRPIKAVVYSSDHNILLSVTELLVRHWDKQNVAELYESSSMSDTSAELARFRNGRRDCRICPICQQENDVRSTRSGRTMDRCTTRLMEVVTTSTGDRFIIEPERVVRASNVPLARLNGEPLSSYWKNSKFWAVGDLLEVDIRDPHPVLPRRQSESHWNKHWGAKRCRELAEKDNYEGSDWYFGPLPETENGNRKVMEVRLHKWQDCGKYHNSSRWYEGPRLMDVPIKQVKEDVFVLSLDAGLSHGLDLSFVTHMFLLEPIDDAALLEQVTSRAHRLGATGPVTVETIHVFYETSAVFKTQLMAELSCTDQSKSPSSKSTKTSMVQQNREKALNKIVCHHCYRQFDSYALANAHEQNNCPRNPEIDLVVDRFRLSSVYKNIKPPLPLSSSAGTPRQNNPQTSLPLPSNGMRDVGPIGSQDAKLILVGVDGTNNDRSDCWPRLTYCKYTNVDKQ